MSDIKTTYNFYFDGKSLNIQQSVQYVTSGTTFHNSYNLLNRDVTSVNSAGFLMPTIGFANNGTQEPAQQIGQNTSHGSTVAVLATAVEALKLNRWDEVKIYEKLGHEYKMTSSNESQNFMNSLLEKIALSAEAIKVKPSEIGLGNALQKQPAADIIMGNIGVMNNGRTPQISPNK